MKMSHHGGYSVHNNSNHQMHGNSTDPQGYSSGPKQPRKAQSQDRIPNSATTANSAAYAGSSHLSQHGFGGHSTFSNLNTSVLAQQKRSNSTSNYRSSAAKKPSSAQHHQHHSGSTKKASSTRHSNNTGYSTSGQS